MQEAGPPVQVTPLVADGVMYVTETRSRVAALDLRTGRTLWRFEPEIPKTVRVIGFGPTNRGVALLDDRVYVGTLNAHLVALDAVSGAVRWDVEVADNALGYAITSAPLAIDGKIIIGVSGGEAGIRGFLDAYDARTGKRVWRFYTVPGPGEPGHDTWGGESWKTGGAPTWLTGSFDSALNLLYLGVGNPAPDWNGDNRPGDNLYSCSLIALDAATGDAPLALPVHAARHARLGRQSDPRARRRHRRGSATQAGDHGQPQRVLLRPRPDDGRVPARHGRTRSRRGPAGSTRAAGPIVIPGTEPSETGTLVWPSLQGATNWFSPAFDARRQLLFVPVREMGSRYFKTKAVYEPGKPFMGGGEVVEAPDEAYGAVRALDALTGERRWEHRLLSPLWAGVMATAGGLVFGSTNEGNVYALDAATGRPLWDFQTGGSCTANPISFLIDGRQHIATACGQAVFVFGLSGVRIAGRPGT